MLLYCQQVEWKMCTLSSQVKTKYARTESPSHAQGTVPYSCWVRCLQFQQEPSVVQVEETSKASDTWVLSQEALQDLLITV